MSIKDLPVLWLGPAGSGKIAAARAAIGVTEGMRGRLKHLEIGDYQARIWEWPTHIEMDICDLSMMDKQVLPEVLNLLLETRDVVTGGRKLIILRRVHALSPAAAARLRICLEEHVWDAGATATIWLTARMANGVVMSLMDGFVLRRCSATAPQARGRLLDTLVKNDPIATVPKSITCINDYIAEMVRQMSLAKRSNIRIVEWIRARVYELLGLMVNGGDLVAGLTWAVLRLAAAKSLTNVQATAAIDILSRARWIPSYRTPIMYELILAELFEALLVNGTDQKRVRI